MTKPEFNPVKALPSFKAPAASILKYISTCISGRTAAYNPGSASLGRPSFARAIFLESLTVVFICPVWDTLSANDSTILQKMWNASLSKPPVRKWSLKALPKVTLPSVRALPRSEMPGPQCSPFWQSEACFGLTPKGCQMFIPDWVRKQLPFHPRSLRGPWKLSVGAELPGRWRRARDAEPVLCPNPRAMGISCQWHPAPQHGPNSEGESHPSLKAEVKCYPLLRSSCVS